MCHEQACFMEWASLSFGFFQTKLNSPYEKILHRPHVRHQLRWNRWSDR